MTKKLPDTLSDLIMVAVEDVKKLPDNISLYMESWVSSSNGKVCSVCFAGATLFDMGVYTVGHLGYDTEKKILALNAIRSFDLYSALNYMDVEAPQSINKKFELFYINSFLEPLEGTESRQVVIETMTKVANWLNEKGL